MKQRIATRLATASLHAAMCLLLIPTTVHAQEEAALKARLDEMAAKIQELDSLAVRTQSHMMIDVEYNFANLWFAANNGQWDLASFYQRETTSHIGWTVRARPVRNLRGGGTLELKPLQQNIEDGGLKPIQQALDAKDLNAFKPAYQKTLTLCHACHQAAGLGYLEPGIPSTPPSPTMLHKN